MAPRSAKTKKAADVKVSDNEATKGKGKDKNVLEAESQVEEDKLEKKSKRGKKQTNGDSATKKGKQKSEEVMNSEEPLSNDDQSEDAESVPAEENEKIDDGTESNGITEEAKVGRGRKKQPKKEAAETKPKESSKGKRNPKQEEEEEEVKDEVSAEKPKGRGRGRKPQPKAEIEPEEEDKSDDAEEIKKPTKGRKKAQPKAPKDEKPESETEESQEDQKDAEELEEDTEPKKAGKGKKNAGKKAPPKLQTEDDSKEEPASKKRKVTKKEEKVKEESKEDEELEEEASEQKPVKGKRGQKKAVEKPVEEEDEVQDTGEPTTKRRRKQANDKDFTEDTKKTSAKNKSSTDYDSIDFSNSCKTSQGKEWNFKIASWNVDGVRAWLGKGGLDYIKYEKPDILCLQELKCAKDKLPEEITNLPGYHAYWLCSDKDGYAGVGIYTTKLAMNVQYGLQNEDLDSEGRIITAEYEQFYLICTYVPNSGRKLVTLPKRLKWNEEFKKHVKALDKKKPVIICGDMNVSHNEIDLTNPKTNRKNAGFTDEERFGMTDLLGEGFVDTYRHLYPKETGAYTFWTYMFNCRAKNVGWRLDYFIVSERLLPVVCDSVIREKVYGSDHCPISLFLHLTTADKPKE